MMIKDIFFRIIYISGKLFVNNVNIYDSLPKTLFAKGQNTSNIVTSFSLSTFDSLKNVNVLILPDEWRKAIDSEYKTLLEEKIWLQVSKLPYGKFWVPSHMVLVKQRLADGSLKKCKARLVANGSKQQMHTCNNVSSPTARESSIKLFYTKAASLGRNIRTFDIKGAYLKSNMDTEMYMLLPKQRVTDPPQWVKLLKSIYGLRQAGKLWLKTFGQYFSRINSSSVNSILIFSLFDADTNTDIDVVLFVDDFLTSSENDHSSNQLLHENHVAWYPEFPIW